MEILGTVAGMHHREERGAGRFSFSAVSRRISERDLRMTSTGIADFDAEGPHVAIIRVSARSFASSPARTCCRLRSPHATTSQTTLSLSRGAFGGGDLLSHRRSY